MVRLNGDLPWWKVKYISEYLGEHKNRHTLGVHLLRCPGWKLGLIVVVVGFYLLPFFGDIWGNNNTSIPTNHTEVSVENITTIYCRRKN